jgi:hypothetical protein
VAHGFPVGRGWIDGTLNQDTRKGSFNARSGGVEFVPLAGYPEHWQHRFYSWRQFTEARAAVATEAKGATAHSVLVGSDHGAKVVISRVVLPWGDEVVVVVIPQAPFTIDDWLRVFLAGGVPLGGDGNLHPSATSRPDGPFSGPGGAAPAWLPDPAGRHDYRYWNGVVWTKNVADKGRRSTDPL